MLLLTACIALGAIAAAAGTYLYTKVLLLQQLCCLQQAHLCAGTYLLLPPPAGPAAKLRVPLEAGTRCHHLASAMYHGQGAMCHATASACSTRGAAASAGTCLCCSFITTCSKRARGALAKGLRIDVSSVLRTSCFLFGIGHESSCLRHSHQPKHQHHQVACTLGSRKC